MAVILYFPLSSKVSRSWSSYLLCISQFQVCPYTPRKLNCRPCQSCGWGISKLCAGQRSGIWQPQGHSRAFGTHMHSFLNITKHGGFYWRQQQICRLTHLSWFYACISSLLNQARSQELLSWVDIFVLSWNEISVDLGFDYNLAVMIFLILLSLIYLLYLLFHNIWLFGTDISKVLK